MAEFTMAGEFEYTEYPSFLQCEQKTNPVSVEDPQPEFSAIHFAGLAAEGPAWFIMASIPGG